MDNKNKKTKEINICFLFAQVDCDDRSFKEILQKITLNENYFTGNRNISLIKLESEDDIYYGELQHINDTNLPYKVDMQDDKVLSTEPFKENQALAYPNIFLYNSKHNFLILQNNKNGVGLNSFQDLANYHNSKNGCSLKAITLYPMADDRQMQDVNAFKSIEFGISKYTNLNDETFDNFNKLVKPFEATSIKIIMSNKEGSLNKEQTNKILTFFKKNSDNVKIDSLRAKFNSLNGENAEYNFLQNLIRMYRKVSLNEANLPFDTRKTLIKECMNEFIQSFNL